MGLFDRARRLLLSPADRRLADAEAEAWLSAPAPSLAAAAPNTPPIKWGQDQPPPPPQRFTFQAGYSDHVYQQFSAPVAFEGFGLERIRAAVASHRLGMFYESSALMVAILGFAPVLAALQQATAPILALPRHVHGGDKGLARLVAQEVEEQLVPRGGLLPSPYLPPTLWGTMAIYLRMMGFCVLQHVDGDPDPETGVRPRYTRIWPPWALNWYRSPRKLVALTTEGPVEVKDDGKFTLVADEEEPHLSAAICCLGDETLAGKVTQEARLSFLDFFGKPKLVGVMPEKVATGSQPGNDFFAAVETIYGPDGRGVLPHGSDLKAVAIPGEGSKGFQESLLDAIIHIYMVLTGSAGTIGAGGATGAGPYQPQKGGPWNVRHDLIARPAIAIVRAINQGHIAPYCDQNYGEGIARAKKAGAWRYPVLDIQIHAPDREERIKSEVERYKALTEQVKAEREAGGVVDQDRVIKLAAQFEVQPFVLADASPKGGEIYQYHIEGDLVAPDEARARLGLPDLIRRARARRGVALAGGGDNNYDPDQPRGDDGKWTSGGGSAGGGRASGSSDSRAKSDNDWSTHDDWDPSDDSNRPGRYPGRDAPMSLREKLVKNGARRVAEAEKEVERARRPIDRIEQRIDEAQKRVDEVEQAYREAEEEAYDAEDDLDDAKARLAEAKESGASPDEVEKLKADISEKRTVYRTAERERVRQENRTYRAGGRIDDLEERRLEAEEDLNEAIDQREQMRSWSDLHRADTIEDDEAREEEIDDCLRERERDLAHAKAKIAAAERAEAEADEGLRKVRESYTDERGLINPDKAREVAGEERAAERACRRAARATQYAGMRVPVFEGQISFWRAVKNGDDLNDWWDAGYPGRGAMRDADGDGLVGEEEEQDDDEQAAFDGQ